MSDRRFSSTMLCCQDGLAIAVRCGSLDESMWNFGIVASYSFSVSRFRLNQQMANLGEGGHELLSTRVDTDIDDRPWLKP